MTDRPHSADIIPLDDADLARVSGGSQPWPADFGSLTPEQIAAMALAAYTDMAGGIQAQRAELVATNERLSDAGSVLSVLREAQPDLADGSEAGFGSFIDHDGHQQDIRTWLAANGLGAPDADGDGMGTRGEFDTTMNGLKTFISDLTHLSAQQFAQLQDMSGSFSQMLQALSKSLNNSNPR